jgi:hypothetical protein
MTTIHMDIDGARRLSNTIHGTCPILDDWKRKFFTDCNNLSEVWQSDSYFEFLELMETEMGVFSKKVQALDIIAGRLDAAIAAYWEAQQSLEGK